MQRSEEAEASSTASKTMKFKTERHMQTENTQVDDNVSASSSNSQSSISVHQRGMGLRLRLPPAPTVEDILALFPLSTPKRGFLDIVEIWEKLDSPCAESDILPHVAYHGILPSEFAELTIREIAVVSRFVTIWKLQHGVRLPGNYSEPLGGLDAACHQELNKQATAQSVVKGSTRREALGHHPALKQSTNRSNKPVDLPHQTKNSSTDQGHDSHASLLRSYHEDVRPFSDDSTCSMLQGLPLRRNLSPDRSKYIHERTVSWTHDLAAYQEQIFRHPVSPVEAKLLHARDPDGARGHAYVPPTQRAWIPPVARPMRSFLGHAPPKESDAKRSTARMVKSSTHPCMPNIKRSTATKPRSTSGHLGNYGDNLKRRIGLARDHIDRIGMPSQKRDAEAARLQAQASTEKYAGGKIGGPRPMP